MAFAKAVGELIEKRDRLRTLGAAAYRFVREERNLDQAALRLRNALDSLRLTMRA
jgi:hypothetical protein